MSRAAAVELTVLEHLRELWLRLMGPLIVVFVGGGFAYIFRLQIINFLQRPLGQKLYYTSPTGSFQFVMQVCLLCGVILALPVFIYNILRYIEPIFSKGFSRRFVVLVLVSSLLLTAGGVLFAYYLTLPIALLFFSRVGTSTLHPLISIDQYFSFILGYLATFAIVFQLPLILLFINYIKPFKPGGLTKWRKYLYIGSFAISLIMPSSPDPLSQISLAVPIITLYEASILLIWTVNRKKRRIEKMLAAKQRRNAQFAAQAKVITEPKPLMALYDYTDEPLVARLQESMRGGHTVQQHKVVENMSKVSKVAAVSPTPYARVQRNNFQLPTRDRETLRRRVNQLSASRPRLISDIS